MSRKFAKLFEPIEIGSMHIRNRMCMAPMHTKYASESGEVTQKLIDYFVERAKGGVGLIVVENTCVDWRTGKGDGNPVTIHDDRFRPGLHELVKNVHRWGAKIIPELHHVGRQTYASNLEGVTPVSASPVQSSVGGDMPRAMTDSEIWNAVDNFREAARRSKEVGFDGVELHGAHGYLFNCFLSPRTNKRTDKWGGSFENRSRFAVEVVRAVREVIGSDFPLFFRMSAEESTEGGLTLDDGLRYARLLEAEGVDCLDITHGTYESIKHFPMQGDSLDQLVYLAEAVKGEVDIPVIAVGSLGIDPEIAESVIREGKADMVHFGRELLAEPRLVDKIHEGRFDEARKCIRCNECTGSIDRGHYLACAVNPECGYEYKQPSAKGCRGKRILVVGAGPAGMEYAITAAAGGAEVEIFEKEADIGGLARVCSLNNYKQPEICRLIDYYRVMLRRRDVRLHLGVYADIEQVAAYSPDLVVLAMGSVPKTLPIVGSKKTYSAVEKLLDGGEELGEKICVVGGSGVGIDVALYLSQRGHEVTVIEAKESIAEELSGHLRWHLLNMVENANVRIINMHEVVEITDRGVRVENCDGLSEIECDDVLSAVGFERVDTTYLFRQLRSNRIPVEILGDMVGSGNFMDAIHSGFWQAIETGEKHGFLDKGR